MKIAAEIILKEAELDERVLLDKYINKPTISVYEAFKMVREARLDIIQECADMVVIDGNPELAKQKILSLKHNLI